ncbi:MAG: DUF4388 domain-containing protein [Acidimicrobiales bacterium]|nr:DUF4388 domain-containing protein [Acidimicrobiales bacterium]
MALSGTLDTFALPDVLRLLASTSKTGRLRITGDRGSGSVWVDSGEVVAAELASAVTQAPTAAEVVFGLLRFAAGSFTFEADAVAPNASDGEAMEPILGAAENMLVEWRAIEEVIPSLDVWVGLRTSLDGPDVMVDQARWGGIAAIGSGAQVGAVAERLELNEIDGCRLVKELLELGLVEFIDEPAGIPAATSFEPQPVDEDDQVFEESTYEAPAGNSDDETADAAVFADETPGEPEALLHELDAMDDAPQFGEGDHDDDATESTEPSLAALASSEESIDPLLSPGDPLDTGIGDPTGEDIFAGAPGPTDADDELDPAEMARQLANLSPKAAKAVAAAAKATTEAERDAALAAVEAEDDSVNRGLLLKFLGSVDS